MMDREDCYQARREAVNVALALASNNISRIYADDPKSQPAVSVAKLIADAEAVYEFLSASDHPSAS